MTLEGDTASDAARKLVGAVQRFGFLSAASVADRYTSLVDREIVGVGQGPRPPNEAEPSSTWLVDGAVRLTEAYLRFLDSAATLAGAGSARRPEIERVDLPAVTSGGTSEASLWIHNPGPVEVTGVEVVVSDLSSGVGRICSESVHLTPRSVRSIEPGGSEELRLRVDVPPGQPPGSYHGLALVSAAPDDPVALHLRVRHGEPVA